MLYVDNYRLHLLFMYVLIDFIPLYLPNFVFGLSLTLIQICINPFTKSRIAHLVNK